jgi:hypothetical protein
MASILMHLVRCLFLLCPLFLCVAYSCVVVDKKDHTTGAIQGLLLQLSLSYVLAGAAVDVLAVVKLLAVAGVFVHAFFRLQLALLMDPLLRYPLKSWHFAVDVIVSNVATICAVNGMSAIALAFLLLLTSWCSCRCMLSAFCLPYRRVMLFLISLYCC